MRILINALIIFVILSGCRHDNGTSPAPPGSDTTGSNIIPRFVSGDYIEIEKIYRISKFRSAIGHDYSDNFESCRSMKHYFEPKGNIDWSAIKILAPVTGTISRIIQEWAGTQIWIQPNSYPSLSIIIFHINLVHPLALGDSVVAGLLLGTHIGSQTMSDIAVGMNTPAGWKLVSYFDVITDSVFHGYKARGLGIHGDAIISKEARDADTISCNGEAFINSGRLENWVTLQ